MAGSGTAIAPYKRFQIWLSRLKQRPDSGYAPAVGTSPNRGCFSPQRSGISSYVAERIVAAMDGSDRPDAEAAPPGTNAHSNAKAIEPGTIGRSYAAYGVDRDRTGAFDGRSRAGVSL